MQVSREDKTIVRISIDNSNIIRHELEISSIDKEEPLRIIHSILDEMKLFVIDKIQELKEEIEDEVTDEEIEL